MQKQMKYADRAGVPLVLLMGGDEKARGTVTLKNMRTGEQAEVPLANLATTITGKLRAS